MLNNLLGIVQGDGGYVAGQLQDKNNYYFDNFGEAAIYALIGFLVVFLGIVIIITIIWLVGFIMQKTDNLAFITQRKSNLKDKKQDNKKSGAAQSSLKDKTTDNNKTTDTGIVSADSGEIPDEVKAAIIAAIMAYYDSEQQSQEKCQFVVKRIKRIK